MNTADLLRRAAGRWPDATAFVDTSSAATMTWAQTDAVVDAECLRLREAGVQAGDRVVVRLPTSAAFAVELFAAFRIGAIAVPSSPQAPKDEIRRLVRHCWPKAIVTSEDVPYDHVLLPADLQASADPVDAVGGDEDIALLCYTTASQDAPRGVMLSHRALVANVEQCAQLDPAPVTSGDRVLVAIPLFHVYGFSVGVLQTANVGATAVLAERFDARDALAECVRHEVTKIIGVPTMYADLSTLPADELADGMRSVKNLTSGAAPLHPKVLAAIEDATGLGIFEGYGLTETAPVVTSTLATGYPKPGSVGRPIPGVELRLIDESGSPDPDLDDPEDVLDEDEGVTGLVCVRGANLFSGYWPDGAGGPDADGWFATSDIGYLDTDGDLHLVDRANDLIIVNGFNVYPHEVEDVIGQLDGVREVGVAGVVDDRSGEAVKAVVVPESGASLSEQQVIDHCTGQLARYKVPLTVEFVDALPHTVTGKVRRTAL